jgi:signal transduction histidine kinase
MMRALEESLTHVEAEERVDVLNQLTAACLVQNPGSSIENHSLSLELAYDYCEEALELAQRLSYRPGAAKAMSHLARELVFRTQYPKALEYSQLAGETYREIGDQAGYAEALNQQGIIQWHQSHYDIALDCMFRALELKEKLQDTRGCAAVTNNIGMVYGALNKHDMALDFFRRSLALKEELGVEGELAPILNNIGISLRNLNRLEEAQTAYKRALELKRQNGDARTLAHSENNLGTLCRELGEFDQAAEYYRSALDKFEILGDNSGASKTTLNLSRLYLQRKNFAAAREMIERCEDLAHKVGRVKLQATVYELWSDLHHETGDDTEALRYYKLYVEAQKMIFNEDTAHQVAEVQTQMEYRRKEREAEVFRVRSVELQKRNMHILAQKEEVDRLNRELQQANATKHRFLSILAHDLKGPLNVLLLSSDYILANLDTFDREKIRELVLKINSSSDSLAQLVEDLLEWASSQTQAMQFSPTKIDVRDLVSDTLLIIRPNAEKKAIEIIPPDDEPTIVYADRNMILTVFRNLLSNAIKYTHETGTVSITVRTVGDMAEIAVIDNGVGMTPEQARLIMQSGANGSTPGTANEKGTGLGLVICREFVERNGGTLHVSSILGQGTRFTFSLPRVTELEFFESVLNRQTEPNK